MDEELNYDDRNFTYGYDKYTSDTFYYGLRRIHDYRLADDLRLSVFLIAGLCAGLPALIWALRSLRQLQGNGVRLSVFIASLLFSDALELLLIPLTLAYRFQPQVFQNWNFSSISYIQTIMFTAVRHFGFCLHQLVALEGILSLRNPLCSSRLSSPFVSMPIVISLVICALTAVLLYAEIVLFGLTCIVAGITSVFACKAFRSLSHTGKNPVYYVTVIAMVTFVFLYGPFLCMWISISSATAVYVELWIMCHSIGCMHLFADPLLCVLICRKIPMANISQPDQGLTN